MFPLPSYLGLDLLDIESVVPMKRTLKPPTTLTVSAEMFHRVFTPRTDYLFHRHLLSL